ncbi:hypothetical protein [Nonomuraea sp. B19D2]|uniref:hypothetical protein n=1 Tax=Nonomuraea sp. B19D2 TaxID=3159561 RepID=UPI0032DA4760
MSKAAPQVAAPVIVRDTISIARLHRLAWIDCGTVNKQLRPVGSISHRGHLWPAVACAIHAHWYAPLDHATSPPVQGLDQETRFLTHD